MRNCFCFILLLLVVSCSTQRYPSFSTNKYEASNENLEVKIKYIKTVYDHYEFEIAIKNKSDHSVLVDASEFSYEYLTDMNRMEKNTVYSITPQALAKKISVEKDSVILEKNPYSLDGKSNKELMVEGLVAGTVALIMGDDPEEYEDQREESEDEWETDHNNKIKQMDRVLRYLKDKTSSAYNISPNSEYRERVLFPISMKVKTIEVKLPMRKDVFSFQFTNKY